ncbi:Conserved phage-associated protein [Neorhizobium galegae bv. orientalis]|nr:Conserved phage-associated protein [Neorhizobium galegae bv. orientalis]
MNGQLSYIRIDRLAMTGPDKKTMDVRFSGGVNVIWGASNAGKSFVRRAIDYVLGAEKLDVPDEGIGYDNVIMWLTTPKAGPVSLRRSVHGGDIYFALGHSDSVVPNDRGYDALKASHVQSPNVSKFILQESGFREARLLKNERAEKSPFSLRGLVRYLIVDETKIIEEKSILLHHNTTVTAEDKSLIKFLLTGVDGSSVEQVRSGEQLKAAKDAKLELLSQLAEKVRGRIDSKRSDDDIDELLVIAAEERDSLHEVMIQRQEAIDALTADVRVETMALSAEESEVAEISAMIVRFEELANIFASDLDRLSGLEEGGFLLQKFAEMSCPVCGAAREHQHHDHGLGDIGLQRTAAEAEIAKIRREEAELTSTVEEAKVERRLRLEEVEGIRGRRAAKQRLLDDAMDVETSARSIYAKAADRVRELEKELGDRQLLASYEIEIGEVSRQRVATRQRAEGLDLNFNLTTSEANELSKVIKRVLKAWNYPGGEAVHFSPEEQDIVIDGKNRRNNGAGIRAILHAAFKVAVLLYCKEAGRPHPGFLVLDAPLLAYRPADEVTKYGALTKEELDIQRADLAGHFYAHLHSLRDSAQVIVVENHKSDQHVVAPYSNIHMTRNPDLGREGFFVK